MALQPPGTPSVAFKAARDFLLAHRTDYATACRDFRWPHLPVFNWARDWFDAVLAEGPDAGRTALRIVGDGTTDLSFSELSERSNRLANGLRALGIQRGSRLMLMLGNVPALWETILAAMKLGAVLVAGTPKLSPATIVSRVVRARVRLVVATPVDAANLEGLGIPAVIVGGAPGPCDYDSLLSADPHFATGSETRSTDPLLLYFTSGTTGEAKLVLHSHLSSPVGHLSTMYWLGLQPGDLHLNIASPGWVKHSYGSLFAPWNAGATVVAFNQRFSAPALLQAIATSGATSFCAPPTIWRMLLESDLAPLRGHLRDACSIGEPLGAELIAEVRKRWGFPVRDGYGQTETSLLIGNPPGAPLTPGVMGRAMPGYRIHLLGSSSRATGKGKLCISLSPRPAGLMLGYLNDAGDLTAPHGAFYCTGDAAARDSEGRFTWLGRWEDLSGYSPCRQLFRGEPRPRPAACEAPSRSL